MLIKQEELKQERFQRKSLAEKIYSDYAVQNRASTNSFQNSFSQSQIRKNCASENLQNRWQANGQGSLGHEQQQLRPLSEHADEQTIDQEAVHLTAPSFTSRNSIRKTKFLQLMEEGSPYDQPSRQVKKVKKLYENYQESKSAKVILDKVAGQVYSELSQQEKELEKSIKNDTCFLKQQEQKISRSLSQRKFVRKIKTLDQEFQKKLAQSYRKGLRYKEMKKRYEEELRSIIKNKEDKERQEGGRKYWYGDLDLKKDEDRYVYNILNRLNQAQARQSGDSVSFNRFKDRFLLSSNTNFHNDCFYASYQGGFEGQTKIRSGSNDSYNKLCDGRKAQERSSNDLKNNLVKANQNQNSENYLETRPSFKGSFDEYQTEGVAQNLSSNKEFLKISEKYYQNQIQNKLYTAAQSEKKSQRQGVVNLYRNALADQAQITESQIKGLAQEKRSTQRSYELSNSLRKQLIQADESLRSSEQDSTAPKSILKREGIFMHKTRTPRANNPPQYMMNVASLNLTDKQPSALSTNAQTKSNKTIAKEISTQRTNSDFKTEKIRQAFNSSQGLSSFMLNKLNKTEESFLKTLRSSGNNADSKSSFRSFGAIKKGPDCSQSNSQRNLLAKGQEQFTGASSQRFQGLAVPLYY